MISTNECIRSCDEVAGRDALRNRLIRETEAALTYGLLFRHRIPRIPTVSFDQWPNGYSCCWNSRC